MSDTLAVQLCLRKVKVAMAYGDSAAHFAKRGWRFLARIYAKRSARFAFRAFPHLRG